MCTLFSMQINHITKLMKPADGRAITMTSELPCPKSYRSGPGTDAQNLLLKHNRRAVHRKIEVQYYTPVCPTGNTRAKDGVPCVDIRDQYQCVCVCNFSHDLLILFIRVATTGSSTGALCVLLPTKHRASGQVSDHSSDDTNVNCRNGNV